jgi:CheY-like chemotaxis protein
VEQSILIIDDDEDDCQVVKESLFQVGLHAQIHACLGGKDGLAYLQQPRQNLPTLIILDLNMPEINGLEVLEMIENLYGIPVFVYATGCDPEVVKKAKQLGAVDCIEKGTSYTDNLKFAKKVKDFMQAWNPDSAVASS